MAVTACLLLDPVARRLDRVILLGAAAMGLGVGMLYWVFSRDLSPIIAAFAC